MAIQTKIQWCHHTFNPWRGCVKVSPGCAKCYAEAMSGRNPKVLGEWGPKGHRAIAAESYWRQPFAWDRAAAEAGERRRVFCASLADVFESNDQVEAARARLFRTIDSTPNLDWLLLTKRPENIERFWHTRSYYDDKGRPWGDSKPTRLALRRDNVWLGASVEDQERADERLPKLLRCRDLAPVLFVSYEPAIGAVDFHRYVGDFDLGDIRAAVDWVIVGGESGPGARPFKWWWAASTVEQCRNAGVACFVKQLGSNPVGDVSPISLKDHKGGDPEEWPRSIRVREFPRSAPNREGGRPCDG